MLTITFLNQQGEIITLESLTGLFLNQQGEIIAFLNQQGEIITLESLTSLLLNQQGEIITLDFMSENDSQQSAVNGQQSAVSSQPELIININIDELSYSWCCYESCTYN
jgi:hypothetical protein